MPRPSRHLAAAAAVVLLAAALITVTALPAGAIGAFGPPVTIHDPPCEFDAFNVDLAQDGAGVTHGFEGMFGSDCNLDAAITYVQGGGSSWTREATPYHGFVVAVAQDTTGTYLLYADSARLDLRITKRLADGTYTGGRVLSTHVGPDGSLAQGDVTAAGGQFWAVWREHVTAGGAAGDEFDQTDLFQARTIGGLQNRTRITTSPAWDSMPTVAVTPGTTTPVNLVWSRGGSDFGANPADLRRATGNAAGAWSSSSFATLGTFNFWPDATVVGTTTYVTWVRDGKAVAADNGGGAFTSHTFLTPAILSGPPSIAATAGDVVVGWTTPTSTSQRAFVAERVGGTWTGAFASPSSATRLQQLTNVTVSGGHAGAAIVSLGSRLYSATES